MLSRLIALGVVTVSTLAGGAARAQSIDWNDPEAAARAAADAHPAVRRVEAEARAARERVTLAGAYPNPMLMTGVEDLHVDLSHDESMTMYMVGASQTIPRRSRRNALRSVAELEVQRIELEAASLRAEAERDALFAWYDVAAADSQTASLGDVGKALESLVDAVRARYEGGTAIQADIVRAALQRSEVDRQILATNGARRIAAARLLALLGLPLTTSVPPLRLPHRSVGRGITAARTVRDDHPALAALRADVQRREQEVRVAELLARPDISIEAAYGMRPQETDVVSVIARVELPLRRRTTIEPRVREAIAARDAAGARIDELRRALLSDLGAAYEAHAQATNQIAFHERTLLPQSKLAFESTRAAYEGGKTTLDAVLASEAAYLRLAIDYYALLARHIKAIADYEAIQRGARRGAIGGGSMSSPAMESPMPAPAAVSTMEMR